MICFPWGPSRSSIALSSLLFTAVTSALLASSGDEKVFWPDCWAIERAEKHASRRAANAAGAKRFAQLGLSIFSVVRRIWRLSMFNVTGQGIDDVLRITAFGRRHGWHRRRGCRQSWS